MVSLNVHCENNSCWTIWNYGTLIVLRNALHSKFEFIALVMHLTMFHFKAIFHVVWVSSNHVFIFSFVVKLGCIFHSMFTFGNNKISMSTRIGLNHFQYCQHPQRLIKMRVYMWINIYGVTDLSSSMLMVIFYGSYNMQIEM